MSINTNMAFNTTVDDLAPDYPSNVAGEWYNRVSQYYEDEQKSGKYINSYTQPFN
jgi:hypothetical protein